MCDREPLVLKAAWGLVIGARGLRLLCGAVNVSQEENDLVPTGHAVARGDRSPQSCKCERYGAGFVSGRLH
jgi:hypothetical protein